MINRARVAQVKSVFVDKTEERISDFSFNRDFMYMMRLSYGENNEGVLTPGGDLPPITFLAGNQQDPTAPDEDSALGQDSAPDQDSALEEDFFKEQVLTFLQFPQQRVGMNMNLVVLRKLVRLKQNRDHDLNEWALINQELLSMATALGRTVEEFTNPRDFILNFTSATGTDPVDASSFSVLQNVNDI